MKIDPKGSKPPNRIMDEGSVYHFFSGIGRGTAFMRHGKLDWPPMALPSKVPIKLHGKMINTQIAIIAS
jgi:hypothetical protein